MSSATRAQRLQRIVVRMLHDPELRRKMYAEPASAAAELGLTDIEVAALTRPDARAWSVDVHRSDRVLTALLGEFAVSALALMTGGVTLARLAGFFGDPSFHRAVMQRESLFLSFPEYLQSLCPRAGAGLARSVIALEAAIAHVRRATVLPVPPGPSGPSGSAGVGTRWSRAATVMPVELGTDVLPIWERAHAALHRGGRDPVEALLGKARPSLPAARGSGTEWVLVTLGASGPEIGVTGEALGRLLLAASATPREALVALACEEGVSPAEADEILDELSAEGLIVRA